VRAAYERANANDPDGLATLCDESVEFHDVHGYSGRDDALADLDSPADP
jgi:hypothetical protein